MTTRATIVVKHDGDYFTVTADFTKDSDGIGREWYEVEIDTIIDENGDLVNECNMGSNFKQDTLDAWLWDKP